MADKSARSSRARSATVPSPTAPPAAAPRRAPPEAVQRLEVLVVEDDADTQANFRDILELDDYCVHAAATAAAALAHPRLRDLLAIVLDGKLPDGRMTDVLPRLLRAAPQVPVVIVTAFPDMESAVAALQQGAADYILKPLNAEVLRASLKRIRQRQELERDRRRSETLFRLLVDASGCAVVILDAHLCTLFFSPFTAQLTGYRVEETIQRPLLPLLWAESAREDARAALQHAFSGAPTQGHESQLRCADGAPLWLLWNAARLDDYDGQEALLLVGQDITERKRADERVLQTERLAAIGQMMTGLAHESRNALQRSKACLEMLALEVEDRPEALDLVARINKAQDHLHHLYEEVRAYAAPLVIKRARVRLDELWREVWAQLAVLRHERAFDFVEECATDDLELEADEFAIGQVLRNIFENSLAACGERGRIVVRCANVMLQRRGALQVAIRDDGPGLNAEQRAKIFEPFYTTKTRGTGLGMAIARRIVEAHGGTIALGEASGSGAEIVLTLPRQCR